MRISDWSSDVCSSDLDEDLLRRAAEMLGDLPHDLLDRLAPAIAGEGVAVTGIDDQRAARAALHLLAAEFDLGRAADIAREHARDRRAGRQLDIGEVAAGDRKNVVSGKRVAESV